MVNSLRYLHNTSINGIFRQHILLHNESHRPKLVEFEVTNNYQFLKKQENIIRQLNLFSPLISLPTLIVLITKNI